VAKPLTPIGRSALGVDTLGVTPPTENSVPDRLLSEGSKKNLRSTS